MAKSTKKIVRLKAESKLVLKKILADPVTQEYMEKQKQLWIDTMKAGLDRLEELSAAQMHEANQKLQKRTELMILDKVKLPGKSMAGHRVKKT